MLGTMIGDIAGSRFEFDRGPWTKNFRFFTREDELTDDTVMTIAVADALLRAGVDADEKTVKAQLIERMQMWGRRYPNAGYGARFIHWVFADQPVPYDSLGNGSAMRVAAAGWLYPTLKRTEEVAGWTAEVSHNHPEGIKGAQCTAAMIFMARNGSGREEMKAYVSEHYGYDLQESVDDLRRRHRHDETCMDTMPKALICFFESTDFEDAIRNAVSIGGDTDTIAAIAGSMAEAFYGIPKELKDKAYDYVSDAKMLKVMLRFNDRKM